MRHKKKIYEKMKRRDFGESMCNETKLKVLNFIERQLRLYNVTHQRELLIAYTKWVTSNVYETSEDIEKDVDVYLSNL